MAKITLSDFLDPQKNMAYTLEILYEALPFTELAIEFALDLHAYLVFLIGLGIFQLIIVLPWFLYHRLATRALDRSFHFLLLIRLALGPALKGCLPVILVVFLYIIVVGFVFINKIMSFSFYSNYCNNSTECGFTFWDVLFTYDKSKSNLLEIHRYRFGVILIQFGLFVILNMKSVLISKSQNDILISQKFAYDKNKFNFHQIKSQNFYFCLVLYIVFELCRIYYSFSSSFANFIIYFIACFKVLGALAEQFFSYLLNDQMLLVIFKASITIFELLTTCGALEFLDFLFANLILAGLCVLERAYMELVITWIIGQIKKLYLSFTEFVSMILQ